MDQFDKISLIKGHCEELSTSRLEATIAQLFITLFGSFILISFLS